jgi:hypothetical protein
MQATTVYPQKNPVCIKQRESIDKQHPKQKARQKPKQTENKRKK